MKKLIVNADDFGYAEGVNRGIIEASQKGIVTSTSLMVLRPQAKEAALLAKQNPELGVGLHFEIPGEERVVLRDPKKLLAILQPNKVKRLFMEQVELFKILLGHLPTHIDGHYDVHWLPRILPMIKEFGRAHNIPIRAVSARFYRVFYGKPNIKAISAENLVRILARLPDGLTELMCHPGYFSHDLPGNYTVQREAELKTLTDPRIKQAIKEEDIRLINWSEI